MGKKIKLMTVLLCLLLLDSISHSSSIPQEHIHTNPIKFVNTSFFLLLSPSVETQTVFFSSTEKNGPFPKRPPECVNLKTPACCFSVYRGKLSFLQNSDVRLLGEGQGPCGSDRSVWMSIRPKIQSGNVSINLIYADFVRRHRHYKIIIIFYHRSRSSVGMTAVGVYGPWLYNYFILAPLSVNRNRFGRIRHDVDDRI